MTWAPTNTGGEDSASPPPQSMPSGTNAVQQVAAHSLEALSTAADISYTPQQPQHAAYYTANAPSASHPEYGFVQPENVGNGMDQPGNNIHFILNPSSGQTHSSVIDPSLETAIARAIENPAEMSAIPEMKDDTAEHEMTDPDPDSQVAMAHRTFNEAPA